MAKVKNFNELLVWQLAEKLSLELYKITESFPMTERFGITSQLQRAATSIAANIAEGFGRYYPKDKVRFYYQARGSLSEVESFVSISLGLGYISQTESQTLTAATERIGQLINGLIRSMKKRRSGPG